MSRGVTVSVCEVVDFHISDHSLIHYDICSVPPAPVITAPQHRHIYTPSTIQDFAAAFSASEFCYNTKLTSRLCPDLFLSSFHTICTQFQYSVVPFKVKVVKSDLGLNDTTRDLRWQCGGLSASGGKIGCRCHWKFSEIVLSPIRER